VARAPRTLARARPAARLDPTRVLGALIPRAGPDPCAGQVALGDFALDVDERLLATLLAAFRPSSPAPAAQPAAAIVATGASPRPPATAGVASAPGVASAGPLGALDLAAVAGTDPEAGGGWATSRRLPLLIDSAHH
jgi:hypothetical protein